MQSWHKSFLSKSDYILYLKHPAWLWMKKHAKTLLPPINPATQAIFDTGHEFEQYAEALFAGGVTLGFSDYDEYLSLPERTLLALDEGNKTIFQGRFEHDQLTFICDIIQVDVNYCRRIFFSIFKCTSNFNLTAIN